MNGNPLKIFMQRIPKSLNMSKILEINFPLSMGKLFCVNVEGLAVSYHNTDGKVHK